MYKDRGTRPSKSFIRDELSDMTIEQWNDIIKSMEGFGISKYKPLVIFGTKGDNN